MNQRHSDPKRENDPPRIYRVRYWTGPAWVFQYEAKVREAFPRSVDTFAGTEHVYFTVFGWDEDEVRERVWQILPKTPTAVSLLADAQDGAE